MSDTGPHRATVRTTHADPETVAAAVRPDNTAEMETRVVDGQVVTTIERPTAGGLRTTADDYVTNLGVADRLTGEHRTIDDEDEDDNTDTIHHE